MMNIRAQIVEEARSYLGVPFKHHGRSRRGLDCAGLLYVVYNELIGVHADFLNYPNQIRSGLIFRVIRDYAIRIKPQEAGPGDLILMNFAGVSMHLGIVTDHGIIHSDSCNKRVLEHSFDRTHVLGNGRPVAYFRMNGVPVWQG